MGTALSIGAAFGQGGEHPALLKVREAESVARITAEGRALYESDSYRDRWGAYCASSWALIEQGELREGIRMASRALFLGTEVRNQQALANAKRDIGLAYSYAGRHDLAERYARESIVHTHSSGGSWRKNDVLMVSHKVVGDVELRRGRAAQAVNEYQQALKYGSGNWKFHAEVSLANAYTAAGEFEKATRIFEDIGTPFSAERRHVVTRARGELALAQGRHADAVKLYSEALAAARGDDQAYERVWVLDGLARAHLRTRDNGEALKHYLAATEEAERVRARFRNEEFKSGLFGDMRRIFDAATLLLAERGAVVESWNMSERGRARALLDMIRNRIAGGSGALAFADPLSTTVSEEELRRLLPADTTVVQYHVFPDRVLAWVVRPGEFRLVTLQVRQEALSRQVDRFREAILQRRQTVVDELGEQLYRTLVQPLALTSGHSLVVIPHDALHYLPYQALRGPDGYLIEQHAISYSPSASALKGLLSRGGMSKGGDILALGNPDLGDPEMALPGAQREVERIRQSFPSAVVHVGAAATKARVIESGPRARLIHLAAHAEVDSVDPLRSRIRLASTKGQRGDLEAREVYRLDLSGSQMVVLSACDSGLGTISNGDEIWGFTRAFLGAGSASLLVSLWPVADTATESLMARFYDPAEGISDRRQALRRAQRALLGDPRMREPFFWAAFNLVGDWH